MKNLSKKSCLISSALLMSLSATLAISASSPAQPLLNNNKQAVNFSWAIQDGYTPGPLDVLSSTEESVEYWQTLSGKDLAKGVSIATTAPGALVRISERSGSKGISPMELEITTPNGKRFAHGKAMSNKVSPQAMRNAGSPFPKGTTGFQLKNSLGHGKFIVKNTKSINAEAQYTLHVFDKQSTKRLSVSRDKANYRSGETLLLSGDMTDSASGKHKGMSISQASGFVRTPLGNKISLDVKKGSNGQFAASLPLNAQTEFGGLYEAYIDAETLDNGVAIKRRVKTAFAVVQPTAEIKRVNSGSVSEGLNVNLGISESGRYEVRGVLYGTNAQAELTPLMASSTAQWLEKGDSSLRLSFDKNLIAESALTAPFEIRYLQLSDQSRMGNLELNPQAINISE